MGLFTRIQNFFSQNKINILYLISYIAVFFMLGDNAWASDTSTKDPSTEEQVLSFLHGFMGVIAGLLGFMSLLVQVFLNPEWTSGSFIGLDVQLKTMWIMISNVVYFVFALLFVWIALMNIVGQDGDNYKLKQAIPKFIVGVLIVPFSWFFVQFVISVSSVLTVAVLSLPYNEFQNLAILDKKIEYCDGGYTIDLGKTGSGIVTCGSGEPVPTELRKITNDGKSIFGIMTLYTYGVMNVEKIGKLYQDELVKKDPSGKNQIKSLFDLSLKLIFDIIFIFAYLLLMIALVMALITRGFMLWMYTLFSPVFGLLYFFGKAGEGFGEGGSKSFNIKEFIALSLIPFYVSIALVFGFIFLVTASQGFGKTVENQSKEALLQFTDEGMKSEGFMLKGNFGTANESAQANLEAGTGLFAGFASSLGTMLLQLLGIAVLWMAVMAALKQSEITKGVVEPIASFGNSIGELIRSAPKYAPILPAPGGGMMSTTGLSQVGDTFKKIPQDYENKKMAPILSQIQKNFGVKSVDQEVLANFKSALNDGIKDTDEWNKLRKQYFQAFEEFGPNNSGVKQMESALMKGLEHQSSSTIKNQLSNKLNITIDDKITLDDKAKVLLYNLDSQNSNIPDRALITKYTSATTEGNLKVSDVFAEEKDKKSDDKTESDKNTKELKDDGGTEASSEQESGDKPKT